MQARLDLLDPPRAAQRQFAPAALLDDAAQGRRIFHVEDFRTQAGETLREMILPRRHIVPRWGEEPEITASFEGGTPRVERGRVH